VLIGALVGVIAALALAVLISLLDRAFRQHQNAESLAIRAPPGIEGADDDTEPAALANAYVAANQAPEKMFIAIPGAGHTVSMTFGDQLLDALGRYVRPLAVDPHGKLRLRPDAGFLRRILSRTRVAESTRLFSTSEALAAAGGSSSSCK